MQTTRRYLTVEQAAEYLSVSLSFLNKARVAGNGPAFLKAGVLVRYAIEDLDSWLAASRRQSTASPGQRAA